MIVMRTAALLVLTFASAAEASPRGDAWWGDIAAIASDATEGRLPGSKGYDLAADHVIARFKAIGLAPAGDAHGFKQSVAFEEQR
jgi:hypothetical protein